MFCSLSFRLGSYPHRILKPELKITADVFGREVLYKGPSTGWWAFLCEFVSEPGTEMHKLCK